MSLADVTSARSSPSPDGCPECDNSASVTSDLHKYQVACTCKPGSAQYACADDPGPPPPSKTDTPPALPPRPPNSRLLATNRRNNSSVTCTAEPCRRRKYAWWCVGCGALAAALGGLLAAQHILLRAYTASPHHLETVPAAVPAAMLVLTGVCIMSLARRRNRYSYMIKLVGACCLACALTCVLVTITTTVIHMNKLQTLKFCEFTKLTKTCTCFSMPPDSQHTDDEGVRCVFEGVTDCSVVHGALYWCLRGVFALSVSAVLVCIFTCMLAYQLLSHERKKMYWEQLELRCRSLYRPPTGQTAQTTRPPQSTCSCCAQCQPAQPGWDISLQHRFWAPGRIGNLYSPNPGAGRKASAWSWFPWPRSNSHHSRCRRNGAPQSGDSAYGFCDESSANPNPNPNANTYDERTYPSSYPQFPRTTASINPSLGTLQSTLLQNSAFPSNTSYPSNSGSYPPNSGSYPPNSGSYPPNSGSYPPNSGSYPPNSGSYPPNSGSYPPNSGSFPPNAQLGYAQEFGEASGSFDAQTGVWGPPPPYSPQGRSGSRQHLHHPDPATATLLHHHHIDHRNSALIHDHTMPIQSHTCRNSFMLQQLPDLHINSELARINPELAKLNPELVRLNPELVRLNPELVRLNPELVRLNPELVKLNPELMRLHPELARLNPEIVRLNPELARLNPEMTHLAQIYPPEELARLQLEMARLGSEGRFSTLRGHLVPYRNCQRSLGLSTGNLRDCRLDDPISVDCLHQNSASKGSDQSSDSCPKLGKENLGFQNDKNSPVRSSMQDCRGTNQNAESEVYFADVSSCCNISVKADCCKPNVSLVGTIENHPESTSESDTGSFTLTRSQRPQPQVGSKRRLRQNEKHLKQQDKIRHDVNGSLRLTEQQIEQLNNSMRMSERIVERMHERDRLNDSRIERIDSRDRLNERMNDSRNGFERMELSERMNESRLSDRLNESRMIERMNESRLSERNREGRFEDRRMSDLNSSSRMEGSPNRRAHVSPLRLRSSPKNLPKEHLRQSSSDSNKGEFSNTNRPNLSPNKEFFVPNNMNLSPISPNTEESLISDEERQEKPYANEAESSKCLGPDAQYEKVREEKEGLKTVHNRCCSDTNTMDSGWQSGSEKQVTD